METRTAKKQMAFRLNENLVSKLKEEAKKENRSLSNYVECILMESVYNTQGIVVSDEVPKDFYRAISVDEAKARVQKGLRKMFNTKREQEEDV
ncbi:hypothetical protein SDC9_112248 [bioreactor metagenome]|uniref:Toxin-antitoxin system protein n=1 Tax=bioreactor metagenome TaxID=1076179 RepID=A0A645BQ52_9ZZZZ